MAQRRSGDDSDPTESDDSGENIPTEDFGGGPGISGGRVRIADDHYRPPLIKEREYSEPDDEGEGEGESNDEDP